MEYVFNSVVELTVFLVHITNALLGGSTYIPAIWHIELL